MDRPDFEPKRLRELICILIFVQYELVSYGNDEKADDGTNGGNIYCLNFIAPSHAIL